MNELAVALGEAWQDVDRTITVDRQCIEEEHFLFMICNSNKYTMFYMQHRRIKNVYMKFVSYVRGRYFQRILFSSEMKEKEFEHREIFCHARIHWFSKGVSY
jgi:hypothetical protein